MIPIPLGGTREVELSATIERALRCEFCGEQYGYRLTKRAIGSAVSLFDLFDARAEAIATRKAQRHLNSICSEPDLVACPSCGRFPSTVREHFRSRGFRAALTNAAGAAAFCLVLSCLFLQAQVSLWLLLLPAGAILAVGSLLSAGWYLRGDRDDRLDENERMVRIASSPAMPLAKYRAAMATAIAAQAPVETVSPDISGQNADANFDWLGEAGESSSPPPARLRMRKLEAELVSLNDRQQVAALRFLNFVVVGALIGVLLNVLIFRRVEHLLSVIALTIIAWIGARFSIGWIMHERVPARLKWLKTFHYDPLAQMSVGFSLASTIVLRLSCLAAAAVITCGAVAANFAAPRQWLTVIGCELAAVSFIGFASGNAGARDVRPKKSPPNGRRG